MLYKAFISYNHAADSRLAPILQLGLQAFAKPWYRLRACRIFRDQTSLSVTPKLWSAVEGALLDSEYFILLASPEAASSEWVNKEVAKWMEVRGTESLLIVLTGGAITWDAQTADFDWGLTTALPGALAGKFREEPLHLDLRWAKGQQDFSPKDPRFMETLVDLSCTLRGMSKDELLGSDVREHRRTRRVVRGTIAVLLALTAAAIFASVQMARALKTAEQRRIQARGVAESVLFELDASLEGVPEAANARKVLNNRAGELLVSLGKEKQDLRTARALLVQHERRGEAAEAEGRLDSALAEYRECLLLARRLASMHPMEKGLRKDVSTCLNKLGDLFARLGAFDSAAKYLETDLVQARELLQREPDGLETRNDLAISLERLGKLRLANGDTAAARKLLFEDLALMRELRAQYPTNRKIGAGLGMALKEIGRYFLAAGNDSSAERTYAEALTLFTSLGKESEDTRMDREASAVLITLGDIELQRNQASLAVTRFEPALRLRQALLKRKPDDPDGQADFLAAVWRLADAWNRSGKYSLAVPYIKMAIALDSASLRKHPDDVATRHELALDRFHLAGDLIHMQAFAQAKPEMDSGIALLRAVQQTRDSLSGNPDLINSLCRAGLVELRLGNAVPAADRHGEVLNRVQSMPAESLTVPVAIRHAYDLHDIADAHLNSASGSHDLARRCARFALARLEWIGDRDSLARRDKEFRRLREDCHRASAAEPGIRSASVRR